MRPLVILIIALLFSTNLFAKNLKLEGKRITCNVHDDRDYNQFKDLKKLEKTAKIGRYGETIDGNFYSEKIEYSAQVFVDHYGYNKNTLIMSLKDKKTNIKVSTGFIPLNSDDDISSDSKYSIYLKLPSPISNGYASHKTVGYSLHCRFSR